MIYSPAPLPGVWIIDLDLREDERGFFARSWCAEEFAQRGLNPRLAQCNISFNQKRGTVRGMHFQKPPFPEAKLIRCTRGAIFDVALDLRPDSSEYLKWFGVELTADNRRLLYIPEGLAHGFQTLANHSEVFYQMAESYHPECAAGARWNDPAFSIAWPIQEVTISARDAEFPLWQR